MALSLESKTSDVISIDDYVAWVEDNVDLNDQESIFASAESFLSMSRNPDLLTDVLHSPLKDGLAGELQQHNGYTDATFMLATSKKKEFYIRANVWHKPKAHAGKLEFENELYSYNLAHDHNFDFLTVGYHGSGYRTEIYEYDNSAIIGYVGEPVELTFLEEMYLKKGKAALFRKSQDVHIQYPPKDLTISINLIVLDDGMPLRQQYTFDIGKKQIKGYVEGRVSSRTDMITLAQEIGDENTVDILYRLAEQHPCQITRAQCFRSIAHMQPHLKTEIWNKALQDKSELVRREARLTIASW